MTPLPLFVDRACGASSGSLTLTMHLIYSLLAAAGLAPLTPAQETPPAVQEARPVAEEEREHSVVDGALRATSLFRSERGLDRSARELLEVIAAVDAAGSPRAEDQVGGGAAPLEFFLAESPAQLGKQGDRQGERVQWDPSFRGSGAPAVAVVPRLKDRVLFGTGLPPGTRRLAALAAAYRLAEAPTPTTPAWLVSGAASLRAQRGLEAAGHARAMALEPWTSSGLFALKSALEGVELEARPAALLRLAAAPLEPRGLFDPAAPMRQTAPEAARMLMALAREGDGTGEVTQEATHASLAQVAAQGLKSLQPRWVMEGGAIATHPTGWMVTATRATDALVLESAPAISGAFRVEASLAIFANDPKFAGQADIVLGDVGGDRLLLAINTREGVYLFRRAAPGDPYVLLADVNQFKVAPFSEIAVQVDYDGEVLEAQVGEVKLPPVRLTDRRLDGAAGFGAHAGSTVFYKRFRRTALR